MGVSLKECVEIMARFKYTQNLPLNSRTAARTGPLSFMNRRYIDVLFFSILGFLPLTAQVIIPPLQAVTVNPSSGGGRLRVLRSRFPTRMERPTFTLWT